MPKSQPSQWRASLIDHLREAKLPSRLAALKWLCTHMDDYLERFIGFVQSGTLSTDKIVEGDLFVIVQVATGIIDEQLMKEPRINGLIRKRFTEFQNTISWMERTRDPTDIALIQETYASFKDCLLMLRE
jgi:hypothetical protein